LVFITEVIKNGTEVDSVSDRNEEQKYFLGIKAIYHGTARPQVADRGRASDKDGSCE